MGGDDSSRSPFHSSYGSASYTNTGRDSSTTSSSRQYDYYDQSSSPPSSHTLIRVVSAIAVVIGLLILTVCAAMYKLGEEEALVQRAHASLIAEKNDDLCILQKSDSEIASCPYPTIKFYVPAAVDGKWHDGFSFIVFKKSKHSGDINEFEDLSMVYSENGKYLKNTLPEGMVCKNYMSEVCLQGDYVLYASSENTAVETGYVVACDKYRIESSEALDFTYSNSKCSDEGFLSTSEKINFRSELPDLSKSEANTVAVVIIPSEQPPDLQQLKRQKLACIYFGIGCPEKDYLSLQELDVNATDSISPTPSQAVSTPAATNCYFMGLLCSSTLFPTSSPSKVPTKEASSLRESSALLDIEEMGVDMCDTLGVGCIISNSTVPEREDDDGKDDGKDPTAFPTEDVSSTFGDSPGDPRTSTSSTPVRHPEEKAVKKQELLEFKQDQKMELEELKKELEKKDQRSSDKDAQILENLQDNLAREEEERKIADEVKLQEKEEELEDKEKKQEEEKLEYIKSVRLNQEKELEEERERLYMRRR